MAHAVVKTNSLIGWQKVLGGRKTAKAYNTVNFTLALFTYKSQ